MAQASYITQSELEEAVDINLVRRLGSDTSAPAGAGPETIIDNAIERASARIEGVALRAGRYTVVRLNALQTADSWILKGLCAELTIVLLYERRGGQLPRDIKTRKDHTDKLLDQLNDGQMIFGDDETVGAGKVSINVLDANERQEADMVSDTNFFPVRRRRLLP